MSAERQKLHPRAVSEAEPAEPPKEKRVEYLTARQLAEVLQISESTIHKLRRAGKIPAVVLTERLIRFNLKDVKHALRPAQTARTASEIENEPVHEPSPQLSFDDLYAEFDPNQPEA